jgi:hypothetical protein
MAHPHVPKGEKKGEKKHKSLLGVTDVYQQLAEEEALAKDGKLNDENEWTAIDDDDDDEEGESFLQTGDNQDDDDEYGDDRLDGGMEMMGNVVSQQDDEDDN